MTGIVEKILAEIQESVAEGLGPSKHVPGHVALPDGTPAVYIKSIKPSRIDVAGRPAPVSDKYWAVPVTISYPDGSIIQGNAEVRVDEAAGVAVLRRFRCPGDPAALRQATLRPATVERPKAYENAPPGTCPICDAGGPGPSHNGSANCMCGSLASGGTRAHCTCNLCF